MRALEEFLTSWRANPDADATIAVCSFLGSSEQEDLIREVGASAETWHAAEASVMLAVGRMYLDAGLLREAQTALVTAGKADARDWRPFRYLGEVLLRRGDALRAEKVLSRALQLEAGQSDVELWHGRAVVYSALQKRVGPDAVATEVARSMPKQLSIAPPPESDPLPSFAPEAPTEPRKAEPLVVAPSRKPTLLGLAEAPLPRFDSADPVRTSQEPIRLSDSDLEQGSVPDRFDLAAKPGGTLPPPPAALFGRGASAPAPLANAFLAPKAAAQVAGAAAKPKPAQPLAGLFDEEAVTVVTPPPFLAQAWASPAPPVRAPAAHAPSAPVPAPRLPSAPPPPAPPPPAQVVAAAPPAPPARSAPPPPPRPAPTTFGHSNESAHHPPPTLVLEHLARVGLYEPGGGAAPAWEAPPRQKSRGTVAMLVATVLVGAAGIGGFQYSKGVKAERAREADTINAQVDKLLKSGSPLDLRSTDARLTRSFELDSLSPRAARLWLRNRVLGALLLPGESRGIDAAVHRGRTVGVPERELVSGKVTSFLVEGDLAGGAALLARADADSGKDALYQLAAASVLERAGDRRALERYQAAVQLAPDLAAAEMLLARLLLLEAGAERAKPVIESLRKKTSDTPVTRALSALAWVVGPNRADDLPQDARPQPGDTDKLPAPLAAVPAMVEAVQAMLKQDLRGASKAIDSAIPLAMTPSIAAALGFLAIEAGDEIVARKAALRALQFAAVYPRARTLAARVALLGGRIDEAQKAIEELDPGSADVAIVRAVVAYESLESADLRSALEALGNTAVGPAFAALEAAPGIIDGTTYPSPKRLEELAAPEIPWGEFVALDAALDTGNLVLAEKLLGRREVSLLRPVHLRRLARLRRLQGKIDEALDASLAAASGGVSTPLLLERLYELLAKDDAAGAKQLIGKYPALLGPLAGWAAVLTDVATKQVVSATVRLSKLELPPDGSPLAVRVLVARALVVGKDKRAKPYLIALLKKFPKHPEVLAAAAAP